MNILVKINPATYRVNPTRQLVPGAQPATSLGITILGHTVSIGDDLMVVAAFGLVMVILAMWSFSTRE